jgi:hypothetical protein
MNEGINNNENQRIEKIINEMEWRKWQIMKSSKINESWRNGE